MDSTAPNARHASSAAEPDARLASSAAEPDARLASSAAEPDARLASSAAGEGWDVLDRARELAAAGEQFALATVVWRAGPTSGQQGSRAVITADGVLHGFIGGACAEP